MERLYKNHYIEKQAKYKGLQYTILFNKGGWRTAYIDVTSTELKYIDYQRINIDVHGGLTYSASYLPYESGKIIDSSKWYIGWDYAHYSDGYDFDAEEKYFGNLIHMFKPFSYGHIYSLNDVERDCHLAIDDIVNHNYGI